MSHADKVIAEWRAIRADHTRRMEADDRRLANLARKQDAEQREFFLGLAQRWVLKSPEINRMANQTADMLIPKSKDKEVPGWGEAWWKCVGRG